MPSVAILNTLYFTSHLAHNIFPTIPIKFASPGKFFTVVKLKRKFIIFFASYVLLLISSATQVIISFRFAAERNLFAIVFQGFLSVLYFSAFIVFFAYQFLTTEFCCLLNNIVRSSSAINVVENNLPNRPKCFWLVICAYMVSAAICTLCVVIIPFISVIFPCLYNNTVYTYLFESCESFLFRIFVYMLCIIFMTPIGLMAPFTAVTMFLSMSELTSNLHNMKYFIKAKLSNEESGCCYKVAMCYRIVQLFATLVNRCYQMSFWPVCEFIGSGLIIAMMYAILVYGQYWNGIFKLGLLISILTVGSVICVPLLIGSHCLSISKYIIVKLKRHKYNKREVDKWNSCFLKSCKPISLKIGPFHEMDRTRVPCLVRFILQRTIFLVFKTRDGLSVPV